MRQQVSTRLVKRVVTVQSPWECGRPARQKQAAKMAALPEKWRGCERLQRVSKKPLDYAN